MRAGEVVPTLCPIRAHSRAFQPTSTVQAVAGPSFRIQLERALLSCPVFFFRVQVCVAHPVSWTLENAGKLRLGEYPGIGP